MSHPPVSAPAAKSADGAPESPPFPAPRADPAPDPGLVSADAAEPPQPSIATAVPLAAVSPTAVSPVAVPAHPGPVAPAAIPPHQGGAGWVAAAGPPPPPPGYAWAPPPPLPPAAFYQYQSARPSRPGPGRTLLRAGLAVTVAVALLCGFADTALVLLRSNPSATFVGGAAQAGTAIQAMLARRAAAVIAHDEKAFLAGVDADRPNFLQREKDEFANLQALDVSAFTLTVDSLSRYSSANGDPAVAAGFDHGLAAVAVTVRYSVRGVDDHPVAAPWIPFVGERDGHWMIADDLVQGDKLPEGIGGLPWETGPVVVKRSPHVVAVISKDDAAIAQQLMQFAETGVANALQFQPDGWPGKVLVTAVSDSQVIGSYFRDNMEQLGSVAAVAVPAYNDVYEWHSDVDYVTSRVLFNPDSLGGDTAQLQMTLTHEFIHVATGPFTTGATPTWLVEGIAEYVAEQTGRVPDSELHRQLEHYGYPKSLPDDGDFYGIGYRNYLYSALACRYVASAYGKAKLLALYRYFTRSRDQSTAVESTLGVSEQQLTAGWLSFLRSLK